MKPEPYDQIMDDRAEEEARLAAEEAENAGAIAKAEAQEDMKMDLVHSDVARGGE